MVGDEAVMDLGLCVKNIQLLPINYKAKVSFLDIN